MYCFAWKGEPNGTFYIWTNISALPDLINDGLAFFEEALKRKVMTVSGTFFDIDPGNKRGKKSPFQNWLRFSFGPPEDNMIMGLERLEEIVESFR